MYTSVIHRNNELVENIAVSFPGELAVVVDYVGLIDHFASIRCGSRKIKLVVRNAQLDLSLAVSISIRHLKVDSEGTRSIEEQGGDNQ